MKNWHFKYYTLLLHLDKKDISKLFWMHQFCRKQVDCLVQKRQLMHLRGEKDIIKFNLLHDC